LLAASESGHKKVVELLLGKMLELCKQVLGPEHPRTLARMTFLA
jgi:hypothetical protein